MKEFNFNTLRNLPVPERWIENALSIPEREEAPVVVPFWKKPRFIATAASLLLVTALSIALFLSMGGKSPVPVKPDSKPSATEIIWSTNAGGETVATEVVPADGQDQPHPTEPQSALQRLIDRVFGATDSTAPTESADRSGRTHPTSHTAPAERGRANSPAKPAPTEGGKPAVIPTAPRQGEVTEPPVTPTEPPAATEAIKPTERQPYEPQQPPTATPWNPSYPSEAPTEATGEQPTGPPQPVQPSQKRRVLYVSIPQEAVPSDGVIYCSLTVDGEVLGDEDRYAEARRMTFLAYGAKYTYYYVISDYVTIPAAAEGKTATYEVYDRGGKRLQSGSYQLR